MLVWPYFARAREHWHSLTSLLSQNKTKDTLPGTTVYGPGPAEAPTYYSECNVRCKHCFTRLHQKIPSKDYVGEPMTCRCGRLTLRPAAQNYSVTCFRTNYWNNSVRWVESEKPERQEHRFKKTERLQSRVFALLCFIICLFRLLLSFFLVQRVLQRF